MRLPRTVGTAGKVVPFLPRLAQARRVPAAVRPEPDPGRCVKCGSTFVAREPAFLHCRYCGSLTRLPNGSLTEQELFELRSGLRLAS